MKDRLIALNHCPVVETSPFCRPKNYLFACAACTVYLMNACRLKRMCGKPLSLFIISLIKQSFYKVTFKIPIK